MPTVEEQEMMTRIRELAARINRHKNQQAGVVSAPARPPSHRHTGYTGGYRRGGYPYGGHSVARTPIHRHRTLVLNGASQPSKTGDPDSGATSDASNQSWVTRSDRHLQLINSSVYEKDSQARTRAIEETRRQKRAQKDDRERVKLINHMAQVAAPTGPSPNSYEITIHNVRFLVAKNGSKLIRVPHAGDSANDTPKMAVVGGVKFYRSKNGNLYRHGIVKAQRQFGTVKKINVPCKRFSMTGSCLQGPKCRYIHDPAKVAACKDFLLQGECLDGDACDLSHDLTPERTPACLHFAKDNCTKSNCRYAHVKVSPGAPVCRSFGIYGYCERGADCPERHAFECPDFSNTGVCKTKGCKLPHRERASALRKANIAKEEDEDMEDLSSDDDGEPFDSDDVDSDEVDEFIGRDELDLDLLKQDYIAL